MLVLDIKSTPEQLIAAVNETTKKTEALEAKAKEDQKKITDLEASLKIANDLVVEQKKIIKESLTIINKGSFLDGNSIDARNARLHNYMGKFFCAITQKNIHNSKLASKNLAEMGAVPLITKGTGDTLDWNKAETFLDKTPGETGQKVASSTPLTGDDSDANGHNAAYTVPPEYMTELIRIAGDASLMMGKTSEAPVSGITAYFPSTDTELTFTENTNQATANTEKHVVFGQKTLTTRMFNGYVAMADMFQEDTNQDIGRLLTTLFMEAWGMRYDYEVLAHATYGALYTGTLIYDIGNTSFTGFDSDAMLEMLKKFTGDKQKAKKQNAEYFMDNSIWANVLGKKDADGNYKIGSYVNMPEPRAWGKVINETSKLPDIADDAPNTKFAILVNPKFLHVGMRRQFRFMVFPATVDFVTNNLIYFQCTTRAAFLNTQPGATVVAKTKA
jgi:HK97 family phage major capsid protein